MSTHKKIQSGNIIVLSFGHMMHDIYSSFLSPLIPLLVEKLGISLSMAGMLDVIRNLPSLFNPVMVKQAAKELIPLLSAIG